MIGDENSVIQDSSRTIDFSRIMERVFLMMTVGLVITGITSLLVISIPEVLRFALTTLPIWAIAELVLVIVFSLNINKMGANACRASFVVYAIVNGITLSTIFLMYEMTSICSTFFITAGMFICAAAYGKATKCDLSKLGNVLLMALWGIIIAGIVNIFIMNNMLGFIISVVGVVIFTGLTAYDVQKIKEYSNSLNMEDEDFSTRVVTWGALSLYLDFINLFLKLLKLFGKRRN